MPFNGAEPTQAAHQLLNTLGNIRRGVQTRWIQGAISDRKGAHCLVGWVRECALPGSTEMTVILLYDALPKTSKEKRLTFQGAARALAHYNDTHTQRGVVRLVDRARSKLAHYLQRLED